MTRTSRWAGYLAIQRLTTDPELQKDLIQETLFHRFSQEDVLVSVVWDLYAVPRSSWPPAQSSTSRAQSIETLRETHQVCHIKLHA